MKILVDVDGVLADAAKPALAWVNQQYGTKLRVSCLRQYNQALKGTDTDIGEVLRTLMEDEGFVRHLSMIFYAKWAMWALYEFHRLTIITMRPTCADHLTKWWLYRKRIPYAEYVNCEGRSKSDFDGDVLIDDSEANCMEFAATGRPAILFDQPWNRRALVYPEDGIHRAWGWHDALDIVSHLAA